MSPKIKRILTSIMTALAIGITVFSGILKLSQSPQSTEALRKMGVEQYAIALGIMEIAFAALFLYPKTMKLGFVLLSCYFAGAIATELSRGASLNALLPIVLVWIAAFLRDSTVLLPTTERARKELSISH